MLISRVLEHSKGVSAISGHLDECTACKSKFDIGFFSVIANGLTDFDCLIKEALLIKKLNPKLNTQLYAGASFQLKIF